MTDLAHGVVIEFTIPISDELFKQLVSQQDDGSAEYEDAAHATIVAHVQADPLAFVESHADSPAHVEVW